MHFRIRGLAAGHFAPLFDLSDAALAEPRAAYLHIHFAAPGCYAARIERV